MAVRAKPSGLLLPFLLGPLGRVGQFCLDCQGNEAACVEGCGDKSCPLFSVRIAAQKHTLEAPASEAVQHLALRAVRRQCLACAGDRTQVRSCDAGADCVLWHYRFGVTPETYRRVCERFGEQVAG